MTTSRLPQDPSYWETLTDRVARDAYRSASRSWWSSTARFSMPLAIGAAAAVIAALVWRPEKPVPDSRPATLYGFAPSDPLAAPFITSATAPTIGALIAIPRSGSIQ
ncbi:MAG TPA: hypothetical protein VM716_02680 [Gemmatimonadales bacterium]|nr:hypothetical protein [Gemmatimonadales bacterium]